MTQAEAAAVAAAVLADLTPTPDQEADLAQVAAQLESRATAALAQAGLPGRAAVQGSVAKGTWLRGGADIDLFLLLDPAVPADRLDGAAGLAAQFLADARRKYAQHPYLTGTFQGYAVDVVPAYAVAAATQKMSAVDRTPFHTAWVHDHLDADGRGAVRLAKRWLKGVGAYGAQTAVGGFSGYLVEVLLVHFGTFAAFLDWLAADAKPRRIALGPDAVHDDVACLVVVDPVDPARNCAAAVTADTLALACAAARAYQATPHRKFFFPAPPRPEPAAALRSALSRQGSQWTGVLLRPQGARMDIVFPQFQRAVRTLTSALAHTGFDVRGTDIAMSADENEVFIQWLTGPPLPASRRHLGPADDSRPNAAQFRAKWQDHEDALGPVRAVQGRLEVEVVIRLRTPHQWLEARLAKEPLGKHVQAAAATAQFFDDPAAAPAAWAPRTADVVLGRMPWER